MSHTHNTGCLAHSDVHRVVGACMLPCMPCPARTESTKYKFKLTCKINRLLLPTWPYSSAHQKMSLLFASYSFKTILYQLLGAGESGRIESLYKLCALKEFLKLLNQNHKGSISIGQTFQVIALGQIHTSPLPMCRPALAEMLSSLPLKE